MFVQAQQTALLSQPNTTYSTAIERLPLGPCGVKTVLNLHVKKKEKRKRHGEEKMKELPGFVFASPETGQALVESCAAGCRFGSSLEPAVGI